MTKPPAIKEAFAGTCAAVENLGDYWLLWPSTNANEGRLMEIARQFPEVIFRVRSMENVPDYILGSPPNRYSVKPETEASDD